VRGDNMRGSYRMMDWELEKVKSLLVKSINNLASGYDVIDFTREDMCPYNLRQGLEALGFVYEDREDNNYDFWWYFTNKEYYLCITFNAESFSLKMFFVEEEV
jgi:hypothetical protein